MEKKLKLGIIGIGNIFRQGHFAGWSTHPDVEIVALCDASHEAAEAAKEYNVTRIYTDYREMLADPGIDIVDICVPNLQHSEISIAALRAGKHVLCEKPDAVNPLEAQKMADAAKETGKILMVMRNNRFRPASQFLKKYIENGNAGEIYNGRCGWLRRRGMAPIGWFTDKALSGGGPLIDLGVHFIDLSIWLMGSPKPVSVVGAVYNKFGVKHLQNFLQNHPDRAEGASKYDVEDLASGFIRFDNGATLQIEFSWASNVEAEQTFLELRGTEAGISFINSQLKIFTEIEGVLCDIYPKLEADSGGHTLNINHFVNCILQKEEPLIVPENGVDMIKILCAFYESADKGAEVRL